jgi:hypothetical protein
MLLPFFVHRNYYRVFCHDFIPYWLQQLTGFSLSYDVIRLTLYQANGIMVSR